MVIARRGNVCAWQAGFWVFEKRTHVCGVCIWVCGRSQNDVGNDCFGRQMRLVSAFLVHRNLKTPLISVISQRGGRWWSEYCVE